MFSRQGESCRKSQLTTATPDIASANQATHLPEWDLPTALKKEDWPGTYLTATFDTVATLHTGIRYDSFINRLSLQQAARFDVQVKILAW